jgi:hypothetical protein
MTFSVAQAFTPGNRKAISFKSPINGALIAPLVFSPRRKRLGYRKRHDEINHYPFLESLDKLLRLPASETFGSLNPHRVASDFFR